MSCASTGRRTRVGRLRSGRAGKANAALYHLTALFRWHASFIEFRPACTHGRSTRTAHTLYPRVPKTAWFSLTDIHVSLLSRKNTGAQARSGERALFGCGTAQLAFCLSAVVPAFAEPDIHSLSRARRPSQKIECVFSASPETVRREPREFHLRCSVGQWRDLAVCALYDPGAFSFRWPGFQAASHLPSSAGTKSRCPRSTARRYATILRA